MAPAHPKAAEFDASHPYRVVRDRYSQLLPTPRLLRAALELIEAEKVDLVQLGHPLPSGLLGPEIRRRADLPYLVFLAGAEVTLPAALPVVGQAIRHVLRNASLLVTVSDYTARAASRQVAGTVPARALRPAISVDGFNPTHPPREGRGQVRVGDRWRARGLPRAAGAAQRAGQAGGCSGHARGAATRGCTWPSSAGDAWTGRCARGLGAWAWRTGCTCWAPWSIGTFSAGSPPRTFSRHPAAPAGAGLRWRDSA